MLLLLTTPPLAKRSHNFLQNIPRYCSSALNLWKEQLTPEVKQKIENHWKSRVLSKSFDENNRSKEKYYVLSMFPYPSGSLHMGHVRVYTISDTIARYQRMQGKNVIHPIGWDAFGLPAENAAIDRKIAPDVWTSQNISHMKNQLIRLGCDFEWDRELTTCDPHYYKWTQDLFLKLFNQGLVYRSEAVVNWDPTDRTVLADEQVDENGNSWRSGAKVEKKVLRQWFVRTTAFAKDLLEGLNDSVLQDWKDVVKLQRHWIGECDGVKFDFKVVGSGLGDSVSLWTSKPEYVEYVRFVAVSGEHILARLEGLGEIQGTRRLCAQVLSPFTNETVPVFVTDEIEFPAGADCYLGIPDVFEQATLFADTHKIFYRPVPKLTTDTVAQSKRDNICKTARDLKIGGHWTSSKLRDWLISRQRYWGTPIPVIHCEKCGAQPVPNSDLPVELPKISESYEKGGSYLAQAEEWVNTKCPKCNGDARRETDTMDTFVDSSWYYLRYLDPKNDKEMFDKALADRLMPVDLYIGGKEHAVLHLYYARFIGHFLHSLGLLPEREPFRRLLVQGMVMGRSYRVKGTGEYLPGDKVKVIDSKKNKAVAIDSGQPVVMAWEKMSKSKYNGIDPEDMFKEHGIDTTRLLILADVSPTSHRNWNTNTFPGILNWQRRLWLTVQQFQDHRKNLPVMITEEEFKKHNDYMYDSRNFYVKGVSMNYLITQQLSVAISKLQGLTNSLRKMPPAVFAHSLQFERALASQIIMLAPMAPHFASELWTGFIAAPNRLNDSEEVSWDLNVLDQGWPETDMDYKLNLVCQVNGCHTAEVKVARGELGKLTKEQAADIALQQNDVQSKMSFQGKVAHVEYKLYDGYEGVLNIVTEKGKEMKQEALN